MESFYDDQIAPKLLEVAKLCQANGIPFVALCEFADDDRGRTEFMPDSASLAMRIAAYAARCNGNVDGLVMAIKRHCLENGIDSSGSIVLDRM